MFKDFAAWGIGTSPDPQVAYTHSGAFVTSGGVGNAWTRAHVNFVPSRDDAYLAVGARLYAMNLATAGSEHLNAQHLTKFQLTRMAYETSSPLTYSPPREVQVVVKPDRLNLVNNPSFGTNTSYWNGTNCALDRTVVTSHQGTAALVVTASSSALMQANTTSVEVREHVTYTAQARVRAVIATRSADVTIDWRMGTTVLSTSVGTAVSDTTDDWTLVSVSAAAPAGTDNALVHVRFAGVLAGESHYVDSVLLEATDTVGDYFDGDSGDDYIWETGAGGPHQSRSFFYENRLDRSDTLLRALRDVVPVGIGVGTPQFGVFTD